MTTGYEMKLFSSVSLCFFLFFFFKICSPPLLPHSPHANTNCAQRLEINTLSIHTFQLHDWPVHVTEPSHLHICWVLSTLTRTAATFSSPHSSLRTLSRQAPKGRAAVPWGNNIVRVWIFGITFKGYKPFHRLTTPDCTCVRRTAHRKVEKVAFRHLFLF